MRMNSLKAVVRRLHKLEDQFGLETVPKAAVPSASDVIIERLVAGDLECALKLMELPEEAALQEWQSIDRSTGPNRRIDIDLTDMVQVRQAVESSLGDLPPERRWEIARKLLAADEKYSQRAPG